ncbi:MAG TPA: hypothetical protein VK308_03310 [Pyrinomonadaceae bacterium]|nr:hypothetical protein [Pyrinomonadaceae bacterium]
MNSRLLKIHWQNRPDALAPCAMITSDAAALSLAEKLLSFDDEKLNSFQGVGAERMVLLTGDGESLPWANGAVYLGRDIQMPSVLLPTTLKPNIPLELFERALNEKFKALAPFVALPERIIPYGKAKTLSRRALEKWLLENQ